MELEYLGLKWDEKIYKCGPAPEYSRAEWIDHKPAMDLPNLPYFIDGDLKISESWAILRHIARKNKKDLLGKTETQMAEVD